MTLVVQQAVQESPEGKAFRNGGRGDRTRARARQAAKRRTFPLINSQIIAVADTGDLELIMSTIEAYLPQMNLVNLSTALHRLAKLASADPGAMTALHHHPTLAGIVETVRGALERAGSGGSPPQCQALSNIAWSLATVQLVDGPLLSRAADLSAAHLGDFKPFELASLLWAFGRLGELDPAARSSSRELFQVAAAYVAERLEEFTFRCLVMLASAFAAANQHDAVLFRGLAAQMLPSVHTASVHELANVAWSFGKVGVRQDKLFSELAQKAVPRLADFKPQELVEMLCSFARNNFFHKGFLEGAAHVAQSLDFTSEQLATALCAFSRLRPRHHVTRAAMLALLPRCTSLQTLAPEELSSLALVVAKCFRGGGGETPEEPGAVDMAHAALPPPIADFFTRAAASLAPRLAELPGPALAGLAAALLAARADGADVCAALGQEAISRGQALESPALLVLLRSLPCASPSEALSNAVDALAAEAARRAETLQPTELQALARVVAGLSGGRSGSNVPVAASRAPDLASRCLAMAGANSLVAAALSVDLDLCVELLEQAAEAAGPGGGVRPTARGGGGGGDATAAPTVQKPRGAAGSSAGSCSRARPFAAAPLAVGLVCSVKNTFLHIEEGGDLETPGLQEGVPLRPLPPSLDIIPPEVSPERLEAYRTDYQKFRAGNALGARGELSRSVA